MKNAIKRVSFYYNTKVKRNTTVFDAGLHTLHLKMKDGENDVDFVTRYLTEYFDGCKSRGGDKYRQFLITPGREYLGRKTLTTWGVK